MTENQSISAQEECRKDRLQGKFQNEENVCYPDCADSMCM